ncbi:NAD dependent epimerase dehydratase [Geosmithia morbida]|uniref:NAD dependent epimerase dehydratase n=1 Tax=Geosmithia morbida TaxID=1094350 RepID=A0A9P4YV93_9HYPO|nr:NAD dependent epimerase dehydratase [Geosmithia morbida]KAF4122323.1 NAD dependent epimerase dehydratase [Geosmithia morbida]
MRAAMKQLGYVDTYHMMSCSIENPPDALMWMDALRAKYDGVGKPFTREDWDQLLGNAQAVCDWPAIAFAKELIEAYPEAKVVLTNRDVDSWHASTMRTVYWRVTDPELRWLSNFDWAAGMYYPMLRKFFDTFFRGDFPNQGKDVFLNHYDEVRSLVPRDRLLEYRVQDGWEPLCRFLGEPVPADSPFPNVNDNSDFVSRSRRRNRNQMYNCALRYTVNASAAVLAAMAVWHGARHFGLVDTDSSIGALLFGSILSKA